MDGSSPTIFCRFLCRISRKIAPLKKSLNLKKNRLNQSSNEGDIADLKSIFFSFFFFLLDILQNFLWRLNNCSADLSFQIVWIAISIT